MRLRQLREDGSKGTFIGVKLTTESNAQLTGWIAQNLIKEPEAPDELHVTLLFDRNRRLPHHPIRFDPPIPLDPKTYSIDLFGPEKNVLVLRFESPYLEHRHASLRRKYNVDWSWSEYAPHITLTTQPQEIATDLIPPPFDLILDREYMEEFG